MSEKSHESIRYERFPSIQSLRSLSHITVKSSPDKALSPMYKSQQNDNTNSYEAILNFLVCFELILILYLAIRCYLRNNTR